MKKEINVVGAVVTNDGKILSARRHESMSLPGMWEFPGGKIEPGETPRAALVREMQEELLCTVEISNKVASTRYNTTLGLSL